MDLRDALGLTGASIRTHKLRSVLAAIGVVLGIGSVIAVVTLGAGIQESILGSINQELDGDVLFVGLEAAATANGPPTMPNVFAFTDRDVDALSTLPGVESAGAQVPVQGVEVRVGDEALPGVLVHAARGGSFARFDQGRAPAGPGEAAVSNLTALRLMELLGRSDVTGATLDVRYPAPEGGFAQARVTVVGVEKASAFQGRETVTLGETFAPPRADGTRAWQSLGLRAADVDALPDVKERARAYLEQESDARGLKGERLAFRFDTQEDVARLVSQGVGQFTAFIGAIGSVAMLVGLVGIANIMLVSVQERTREIGVMKATGAARGEIMLVFLVEAVAICVVGAILGIGLGSLMGVGLGKAIEALGGGLGAVPFVFLPQWYAIAVLLGVLVGLVAGLYPAWRAAKVSPVEALRYE